MNVQHVRTDDPRRTALAAMSRAALQAAKTYTVERWAGELAARARPKDYRAQLRELYEDIVRRWRYVQEHGERVPGSARAVLG